MYESAVPTVDTTATTLRLHCPSWCDLAEEDHDVESSRPGDLIEGRIVAYAEHRGTPAPGIEYRADIDLLGGRVHAASVVIEKLDFYAEGGPDVKALRSHAQAVLVAGEWLETQLEAQR